jgi:hypothetical protein
VKDADLIWNRAALEAGGIKPRRGDVAIVSLLYAHDLVMNGGVLHATELLNDDEFSAARAELGRGRGECLPALALLPPARDAGAWPSLGKSMPLND